MANAIMTVKSTRISRSYTLKVSSGVDSTLSPGPHCRPEQVGLNIFSWLKTTTEWKHPVWNSLVLVNSITASMALSLQPSAITIRAVCHPPRRATLSGARTCTCTACRFFKILFSVFSLLPCTYSPLYIYQFTTGGQFTFRRIVACVLDGIPSSSCYIRKYHPRDSSRTHKRASFTSPCAKWSSHVIFQIH